MTLELREHWLWDFWLATDGADHHLFYLQAPRSLGDPERRHWNASIGHAMSRDLQAWRVVDDALSVGPPGAFDDLATWTGSVLRWHDEWAMLYTGTSHAEEGLVQRIGLATSPDLHTWHRHGDAVLEADSERYETLDLDMWHDEAWRDPWLTRLPDGSALALFTARSNTGARHDRGVVGRARSHDLRSWEIARSDRDPAGLRTARGAPAPRTRRPLVSPLLE